MRLGTSFTSNCAWIVLELVERVKWELIDFDILYKVKIAGWVITLNAKYVEIPNKRYFDNSWLILFVFLSRYAHPKILRPSKFFTISIYFSLKEFKNTNKINNTAVGTKIAVTKDTLRSSRTSSRWQAYLGPNGQRGDLNSFTEGMVNWFLSVIITALILNVVVVFAALLKAMIRGKQQRSAYGR